MCFSEFCFHSRVLDCYSTFLEESLCLGLKTYQIKLRTYQMKDIDLSIANRYFSKGHRVWPYLPFTYLWALIGMYRCVARRLVQQHITFFLTSRTRSRIKYIWDFPFLWNTHQIIALERHFALGRTYYASLFYHSSMLHCLLVTARSCRDKVPLSENSLSFTFICLSTLTAHQRHWSLS